MTIDTNFRLVLVIFVVRVCAIISDLVVLCSTWYHVGVALNPRELRARFVRIILQQGTYNTTVSRQQGSVSHVSLRRDHLLHVRVTTGQIPLAKTLNVHASSLLILNVVQIVIETTLGTQTVSALATIRPPISSGN